MPKAFLLEQFEAELAVTREVLLSLPADALDWRPHPQSFSIGRLAMHVASIPGWMPAFVSDTSYDMGAGGPGPAIPASRDDVLAKFERAARTGVEVLTSIDQAALADTWTLLRDGAAVSSMTRAEAIARYVVRHTVHHRGQLTVYLRLRGTPVPPMYGDSADRRLLPPGRAS